MNRSQILILIFLVMAGCGVKRFYQGPPQEKSDIAVLRIAEDRAFIVGIDDTGSRLSLGFRSGYELIPGSHTIEVQYRGIGTYGDVPCFIKFEAEAGKEYQVIAQSYGYRWGAFLRKYTNGYTKEEYLERFSKTRDVSCIFVKDKRLPLSN